MDGALSIKNRIIEDAQKEANKIIEEAQKKAADIIASKEREAEEKRQTILKENEILGEEQKRKLLSAANMDIRKYELSVKLKLIDEAFEYVLEKIKDMSDEEYEELLLNMLLGSSLKGNEEVVFPKEPGRVPDSSIIKQLNKRLKADGKQGKVKVASDGGDFKFGFVIRSDGVELNNSFETILNVMREEIEPEVAAILFEDESGE
ncbi:MAG TPA: V-type ATP synthase subunit E [Clostridiales bacterium]|nr:V-type ATP synthase subunit E [Clostridiales bacterium]